MVIIWVVLGLIGWYLLLRIRYILDQLPKFDKSSFWGYLRGFIFSIALGPFSILFFLYLLYGSGIW